MVRLILSIFSIAKIQMEDGQLETTEELVFRTKKICPMAFPDVKNSNIFNKNSFSIFRLLY